VIDSKKNPLPTIAERGFEILFSAT